MKKQQISTHFFNFGLFLEGLKRLKVIGSATAILSFVVSALIPVVYWMEAGDTVRVVASIRQNYICIPLYFIVFIAPFFLMSLFSYLHKRKEADFFHAIPYTRTCVYVSFVASALAMIFVIQICSALVSGILWAINPHTTFVLSELVSITLISMLCAALLCSLMTLALTLTGTSMTTLLLFGVMCLLPRLMMFYMSEILSTNLDVIQVSELHYLQFDWFMPFAMLLTIFGGYNYGGYSPLWSPACIIYTIFVTLLAFVAAWYFYQKRKSEMAGNTAPSRLAQHIFRCLFTLPFALLIPTFVLTNNGDLSLLSVVLVITLLVYFLYELVTTKRMKNLASATPWLLVLAGGIVLFTLAFYGISGIVLNTKLSPNEVAYVSIGVNDTSYDTYQQQLLFDAGTDDKDVIARICDAYATTQGCDKRDSYIPEYESEYWDDSTIEGNYTKFNGVWREVKFTLKGGYQMSRNVCFAANEIEPLNDAYLSAIEMEDEIFEIPRKPYLIKSIDGTKLILSNDDKETLYFDVYSADLSKIYDAIYEEYSSLSHENKMMVRAESKQVPQGNSYFRINVRLRTHAEPSNTVYIRLYIDESIMPNSFKILEEYVPMIVTDKLVGGPYY